MLALFVREPGYDDMLLCEMYLYVHGVGWLRGSTHHRGVMIRTSLHTCIAAEGAAGGPPLPPCYIPVYIIRKTPLGKKWGVQKNKHDRVIS